MPAKRFASPIHLTRPVLPELDVYKERLEAIWQAQWLTNDGEQTRLLKHRLQDFLGSQSVSLFCNGTAALLAAVKGLDLKGEVITTPFTFPATAHVLQACGIRPVFCDIKETDFNLDPDCVKEAITDRTMGILPVHVFGEPCDVQAFSSIADNHDLKVVYDAAHAFGKTIDGKPIGTFGHATMFSFHATKLYHSAEGGALCCNVPGLGETVDLYKNFGIRNEHEVATIGLNGKMNELSAALGICVLELMETEKEMRELVGSMYRQRLAEIDGITLTPAAHSPSHHYFPIRINPDQFGCNRDTLHDILRDHNVLARKYFYPLCTNYTGYGKYAAGPLPVATRVAGSILCLPLYGQLTEAEVDTICQIISEAKR